MHSDFAWTIFGFSTLTVTHCPIWKWHIVSVSETVQQSKLVIHSLIQPPERTLGMGTANEKISITRCTFIINYNNLLLIWRYISLGQYFKILSAWIQSLWKLWLVLDWLFCILKTLIHAQFCPQKAKANLG